MVVDGTINHWLWGENLHGNRVAAVSTRSPAPQSAAATQMMAMSQAPAGLLEREDHSDAD